MKHRTPIRTAPDGLMFTEGGLALLDTVEPLWKKLTIHHAGISRYFGGQFKSMHWKDRTIDLLEKSRHGKLHIVLAIHASKNTRIGYCVGIVYRTKDAEIESLFVEGGYRKQRIGSMLVERMLAWFKKEHARSELVNVAVGNEGAFGFYRQWGFFPRTTALVRKRR
jgi:diamine N-acetyltransferase